MALGDLPAYHFGNRKTLLLLAAGTLSYHREDRVSGSQGLSGEERPNWAWATLPAASAQWTRTPRGNNDTAELALRDRQDRLKKASQSRPTELHRNLFLDGQWVKMRCWLGLRLGRSLRCHSCHVNTLLMAIK